ncbi:TBP-associated factor 7 [Actinidia rufa]|uniref:TBP-associated factor 7 n=1 Tax=Actinidia rufa TaxID=165716 RepID=A0A7J0GJ24_9ERIC|nr:TBP-associated factor 7 [Actinidia rufa]
MEEQFILRVPPSVAEQIEHLLTENAAASEDKSLNLSFSDLDCSGTLYTAKAVQSLNHVKGTLNNAFSTSCCLASYWDPFHLNSFGCYSSKILKSHRNLKFSSLSEDGRSGSFVIGNDPFPASLLDLPSIVESYKTYDDSVLIKTADIGKMIMVREEGDPTPEAVEYRHGLTPPMRDARRRRFRQEPDLNPELVQRVEKDLLNIMAGGTAENADILCIIFTSLGDFFIIVILLLFLDLNGLHVEVAGHEEDGDANTRNASKKAAPAPAAKPDVPNAGENAAEPERSDSDESDDSI